MRKENVFGQARLTGEFPRTSAAKFGRGASTIAGRQLQEPLKTLDGLASRFRQPLKLDSLYNQRSANQVTRQSDAQRDQGEREASRLLEDRQRILPSQDRLERYDKLQASRQKQPEYVRKESAKVLTRIPGLVGLTNIGNTCFMNATLQCLFNLPDFNDYFLSGKYRSQLKPTGKVADAYGKLVTVMRGTSSKYETPSVLKSALASRHHQFSGFAQQDAQQLLATLLQCIGEDVSRVNKKLVPYKELTADTKKHSLQTIVLYSKMQSNEWWKYYRDREDSIVFDFFSGQLMSKVCCSKCNSESIAFDIFNDLQLSFTKGECELLSMIEQFLKEEVLADDYFCSNCKQPRQSRRKLSLFRLPRVLVLQLKRFSYGKWRKEKINSRVSFPGTLDLSRLVTESKDASTHNSSYVLTGVVNHSGGIDFGHYTAECRNSFNQKWYTFNDSHVTASSYQLSTNHDSSAPYLLFYYKTSP